VAGVHAANLAGMTSIGIGDKQILKEAKHNFTDFTEININFIKQIVRK